MSTLRRGYRCGATCCAHFHEGDSDMKTRTLVGALFAAALIAPVGVQAAGTTDTARPASSSSVKESLTDTTITTKIKAEYAKEKDVSATQIHVKTVNGVVSLSGTARSQAE